jgi:hypothetical protein
LLRLRTRGLRADARLLAFLNGHRLPVRDQQAERGEIWIALRPWHFRQAPFQYLVLMCEPLRPWLSGVPDERELGVPIFTIAREGSKYSEEGRAVQEVSLIASLDPDKLPEHAAAARLG